MTQLVARFVIGALLLVSAEVGAQPQFRELRAPAGAPTSFVCVGSVRTPTLPTTGNHPEWSGCDTKWNEAATPPSNPDHAADIRGSPLQFLFIRALNVSTPVRPTTDARIEQVVVTAGGVTITRGSSALSADGKTIEVPLKALEVLDNGTVATVRIDYQPDGDTGTRRASDTSYFTVKNSVSLYGVANSGVGFWVPVGLFVTNFKATEDGIPFASFPIGIAWGMRFFIVGDFYLGGSVMINYAIYPSTQNQTTTAGGNSSVNLQSGAVGGLLDVDGYLFVGGAYLAEFGANARSPGGMFVVGIGPRLLQWLQAAKQ